MALEPPCCRALDPPPNLVTQSTSFLRPLNTFNTDRDRSILLPFYFEIHFLSLLFFFIYKVIAVNPSGEFPLAVEGWSYSAEHIEHPGVQSFTVASFVVVRCRVTGCCLHITSAWSIQVLCLVFMEAAFYFPFHLTRAFFGETQAVLSDVAAKRCWIKIETRRHLGVTCSAQMHSDAIIL